MLSWGKLFFSQIVVMECVIQLFTPLCSLRNCEFDGFHNGMHCIIPNSIHPVLRCLSTGRGVRLDHAAYSPPQTIVRLHARAQAGMGSDSGICIIYLGFWS